MIVVAGCSWTNPNFTCRYDESIDVSYPKWFDMLDTDKQVKALGISGGGQDTIIMNLLNHLRSNKDVTHVILALTDWLRFSLWNSRYWKQNPQIGILNHTDPDKLPSHVRNVADKEGRFVNYKRITSFKDNFIHSCVDMNVFFIQSVIDYCTLNNIKLTIFQMLSPFSIDGDSNLKFMETMTGHSHIDSIFDHKGTLGAPFSKMMGGINMNERLNNLAVRTNGVKDNRISKTDMHPNALGHYQIATWVNNNVDLD